MIFYFYGSLDLLNTEGSRHSQVRYRINKNPVFEPKMLSFNFMIYRRLQQT